MKIEEKIRQLRESHSMTQQQLADLCGVFYNAVSGWENGKYKPRMGSIEIMSQYFKVSKSEIMCLDTPTDAKNVYEMPAMHKVPMLGTIACGYPKLAVQEKDSYVLAGEDIKADFCLIARGDSMIDDRINDGDVVFCVSTNEVDDGDIAAVVIDEEATLKRVYIDQASETLTLVPSNKKYRPIIVRGEELEKVHIIGKAVAFQSELQ